MQIMCAATCCLPCSLLGAKLWARRLCCCRRYCFLLPLLTKGRQRVHTFSGQHSKGSLKSGMPCSPAPPFLGLVRSTCWASPCLPPCPLPPLQSFACACQSDLQEPLYRLCLKRYRLLEPSSQRSLACTAM